MRVLDLFCKAGGSAMGLHRVWPNAHIVGVDIEHQPNYPFEFIKGDWRCISPAGFDFLWASPVCKRYTQMLNHGLTPREKHPDDIARVRKWFQAFDRPWVIENVAGAPLLAPGMLCGEMFQLRVIRHRFFETNFPVQWPKHIKHNPRGAMRSQRDTNAYYYRVYGHETGKAEWGKAMGIDWMRSPELAQAIPPAYSEYIARQWSGRVTAIGS